MQRLLLSERVILLYNWTYHNCFRDIPSKLNHMPKWLTELVKAEYTTVIDATSQSSCEYRSGQSLRLICSAEDLLLVTFSASMPRDLELSMRSLELLARLEDSAGTSDLCLTIPLEDIPFCDLSLLSFFGFDEDGLECLYF